MTVSRPTVAVATLLALACDRRESGDPAPATPAPAAPAVVMGDLTVDTAAAPRGDRPFIAGEVVRIGISIAGGTGPYQVRVRAVSGDAGDEIVAFDATAPLAVSSSGSAALAATLAPQSPSGDYHLTVEVTDSAGATGKASSELAVIGEGAPLAGDDSAVVVLDVGGRRRARFHAGEDVRVRAPLPGAADGKALVRMWDPQRRPLAASDRGSVKGGVFEAPITIPRLARGGTYGIQVDTADGARARGLFEVTGRSFTPLFRLTVESLSIRGGPDGRAPRKGILERGETLHLEALVGGATKRVEATVKLHHPGGPTQIPLPPVDVLEPEPTSRIWVKGSFQVPESLAKGRFHLEIEVSEGDRVSSIYRDVLVDD